MGNALFVVWRESVEAMLVIGILYAWLKRNPAPGGLRALWIGVGSGVGLALLLGWAMLAAQDELSGQALEWFQTAILFVAAGLITQMVLWMARHGRHMKGHLEAGLARAADQGSWIGIASISALAIAREGAETVIFLYGLGMEHGDGSALAIGALAGFALALLTAWATSRGLRFLDPRHFFKTTGALLLVFAAALLVAGVERLIGMGWLPPLLDPVWDSSGLLDDTNAGGSLLATLVGYRAQPSLMLLLAYLGYWGSVLFVKSRLHR
ncbi:FTR1 family iron permease [Rhodocyclus gracilis]|uniref:FTR1 family iron permease n=1 Tax=Rhodocyclus tenuis TaxID=1066 RepID=A0A6L5JUS4_RHOTE|nr:FTR1 family protein [Rhodocyclus gracilis]MQY50801.1 FTR1 family iron permease [Rhodocyclus gracilis]